MTLDEIRACDRPTLTPAEVASAIGTDAQGIRIMAHECPEKLGFPILLCGRKGRIVKIPRIPFLRVMGVET